MKPTFQSITVKDIEQMVETFTTNEVLEILSELYLEDVRGVDYGDVLRNMQESN